MLRLPVVLALSTLLLLPAGAASARATDAETAFEQLTGVALVFDEGELPRGTGYDRMPSLDANRRADAARILLDEARKYPPGYLAQVGLKRVAVFAALVDGHGDGFRPYDPERGGYVYFGQWNGEDTIVAAFYNAQQLPLTFHHEVFHAVDGTSGGETHRRNFTADDPRFLAAISGEAPYPAARISEADLAALGQRAAGRVLRDAVGDYSAKNPGEDQAETARHLMTALPDALLQAARHPELPGSQRILHVLAAYREAVDGGPGVDWFVHVALGRERATPAERLRELAAAPLDDARAAEARDLIARYAAANRRLTPAQTERVAALAASLTPALIRQRTRPQRGDTQFTVWIGADYRGGGNTMLRADLSRFAEDAKNLGRLARRGAAPNAVVDGVLEALRLVARYHRFIAARWTVSPQTEAAFAAYQRTAADAVRESAPTLADAIARADLNALADGAPEAPSAAERRPDNPYLANVDAAVGDLAWRAAIRRVQPAVVKVGGGTGVNLRESGLIITNAHVADNVGKRFTVTFPDGTTLSGACVRLDARLDLALIALDGGANLPTAKLAPRAPRVGDDVVVIGMPGTRTPSGEATGYGRWHVSVGEIRGFVGDPLGDQSLGRTKHDAWTYWGHSGSPLFNRDGDIVALHNSWDSKTAMRHAVTWQALRAFVGR